MNRRSRVPFDPCFFERLAVEQGVSFTREETFRRILQGNHWSSGESVSGSGASRDQTHLLRRLLPDLLLSLDARTLLDLPCGDFGWMQHLDLPVSSYIGADILPEIIAANSERFESDRRRFLVLDLVSDVLPPADVLLCRDALVHLSFDEISSALENVRRSPIRYLLTTSFPECTRNEDVVTGDWRPINLQLPPFSLPEPVELIVENCTEGQGAFADKSLGLWLTTQLPVHRTEQVL